MNTHNSDKARNKMFRRRSALRYGALALAVMMAAAVLVAYDDSEDVSAAYTADHIIDLKDLDSLYVPPLGAPWTWTGGNTLTFDPGVDGLIIEIKQTVTTRLNVKIVFDSITNTTAVIKNININGNIELWGTGSLNLLLSGSNNISGNILLQTTYGTITIDSADSTGSNNGSLRVDASTNAAIGSLGSSGTIIIKGGTVTANGGTNGAGIGGGYNGSGGTITISGGEVTATGSGGGAGIGGGSNGNGGTITISGGTVEGNGGASGAGIGGGGNGNGGTITISGGEVTAAGSNGAGIGGGDTGSGGTITISGGKVAAASSNGAGIGGGKGGSGAVLTLGDNVSVGACSGGSLPAIQISSMGSANKGYFVNALIDVDLPSRDLLIFPDGSTASPTTLRLPSVDYGAFAIVLPGTTSKNYNIYADDAGDRTPILRKSDDSPVIASINQTSGYNAYNGNANNAVLPVKLPTFIAVTGIKLESSTVTVGTALTLKGTVSPADATSKTIVWTVKSAGTTGATIDGSGVLTATDPGKVTVTATIAKGATSTTAYTQDFEITVKGEGTSIWLWVGIVIAIIAIAVIALFILNRMGKVNIKLKP